MDCVVTNISASSVTIRDLYKTLAPGESVSFSRPSSHLPTMGGLQAAIMAGTVTFTATPTAAEVASGLLAPPASIQAVDMQPVDPTGVDAGEIVWRVPLVAGVGGTADDVTGFALNAVPYKARIMSVRGLVLTAVGAATVQVRTQAAGAGTLIGTLDFGTVGNAALTGFTSSVVLTPGSTVGLFARRSNNTVAGEIFLGVRREN